MALRDRQGLGRLSALLSAPRYAEASAISPADPTFWTVTATPRKLRTWSTLARRHQQTEEHGDGGGILYVTRQVHEVSGGRAREASDSGVPAAPTGRCLLG